MSLSVPPDSSRESLLEEVLGEYMQRLDRGEAVDREQFLARHPEWAEELRAYFEGSDELERLARRAPGERPALPPTSAMPESAPVAGPPPAKGNGRRVGDSRRL